MPRNLALGSHRAVILSPAHALKGLGATARLVMFPEESHGYRARESLLHMLWEQNEWLKRWVAPGTDAAERATTD